MLRQRTVVVEEKVDAMRVEPPLPDVDVERADRLPEGGELRVELGKVFVGQLRLRQRRVHRDVEEGNTVGDADENLSHEVKIWSRKTTRAA